MALRVQFGGDGRSMLKAPAVEALLLHLAVFGSIFAWAFIQGHLRHEYWGSDVHEGAIQATLVSRAPALPLPQDQPPSPNVLATETPSPAPAPEAPAAKAASAEEEKAVQIPVKQAVKAKTAPIKKEQTPAPTRRELANERAALHPQPVPKQDYRAQYGQAAPQMARSMADRQGPQSPVATPGGDFGSRFPYYVRGIQQKVFQNTHQQEVDPRTPGGARVYLLFNVSRDGVPSDVQVETTSRSPTLDTACVRAVQRVESFGPLPPGYNLNSLRVEYYCDNGALGR